MAKLTLSSILASFGSISKLNSNFTAISAAFDNTLSRDGTNPNQMAAPLDMNSQRIINLPAPANASDPARLIDLQTSFTATAFVIPSLSGNAGKFLTTDGTVVSWVANNFSTTPTFTSVTAGTSVTTGNATVIGSLNIGGTLGATVGSFTAGLNVTGNAVFNNAVTVLGTLAMLPNSLTVGSQLVTSGGFVGINTSFPATYLDVNGSAIIRGGASTPVVVINSAATTAVDCTKTNVFSISMGTNIGTLAISGQNSGQTINLILAQDATGNRTMTWPGNFVWSGGSAGVLSTAANKVDYLVATWNPLANVWYAALTKDYR